MKVEPRSGYALNTSFYMYTYGWVDEDLPLTYSMSYYSLRYIFQARIVVPFSISEISYYSIRIKLQFDIKEMDQLSYARALLGPGNHTCVSTVADALQGTSNTSYPVDVQTEALLSEETLTNFFTDAITKKDSFAVLQLVNSASGNCFRLLKLLDKHELKVQKFFDRYTQRSELLCGWIFNYLRRDYTSTLHGWGCNCWWIMPK